MVNELENKLDQLGYIKLGNVFKKTTDYYWVKYFNNTKIVIIVDTLINKIISSYIEPPDKITTYNEACNQMIAFNTLQYNLKVLEDKNEN